MIWGSSDHDAGHSSSLRIAIIVTGRIFVSEVHAETNEELTEQHFDPKHVTALSAGSAISLVMVVVLGV
jgi:hypothetical protein